MPRTLIRSKFPPDSFFPRTAALQTRFPAGCFTSHDDLDFIKARVNRYLSYISSLTVLDFSYDHASEHSNPLPWVAREPYIWWTWVKKKRRNIMKENRIKGEKRERERVRGRCKILTAIRFIASARIKYWPLLKKIIMLIFKACMSSQPYCQHSLCFTSGLKGSPTDIIWYTCMTFNLPAGVFSYIYSLSSLSTFQSTPVS